MDAAPLQQKYRQQAYLLLAAALAACICINYNNLFRWFWHDELISLRYYQLVPFRTTMTDYEDVNNHIGFNLLCNLYLKLIHQQDFLALVYHPVRLRLFLLLITCTTVWVLWRLSLEVGGLRLALINLALLLTTLPFYNFTMQLRGYGLGMLVVLVWMRYVYRYYLYGGWRNVLGVTVFLIVLLYVHPGNIFLIAAMYPAMLVPVLLSHTWPKARKIRFVLWMWSAITAGMVLGIALYLPMIKTLFFNPQVGLVDGGYKLDFFYRIFGANTYFFISVRYLAAMGGMAGIYLYLKNKAARNHPQLVFFAFCGVLYTGAYLVAFLRRDDVFVRIFVPGIGLFIFALGISICWFVERLKKSYSRLAVIVICASCFITFPTQIHRRNKVADYCNKNGIFATNLYYTYFAYNFEPFTLIDLIKERSKEKDFLLFSISINKRDATEVMDYLHIPYHLENKPEQVNRLTAGHDHWYLITMAKFDYFGQNFPSWHFEKVNKEDYFNNLYRVTRK